VVLGSTVRFAINRNGATFDAVTTIAGVGNQSLPTRDQTTTVLYADMNGNGSNDIVWITGSAGNVTFLELFPVRPNLLTKIENGLGLVTEVTYGTAAEQRAQATNPATQWPDPIPTQMIVVTSLETYAQSSDPTAVQHDVMHYSYEAGFYDGEEKQFRGFSRVTQTNEGDDQLLSAESVTLYDTGDGVDRAQMAGLLLQTTMIESGAPLMTESRIYELCSVADLLATGLEFPIRFVCQQSTEAVLQRGAPSSEWATTRIEYDYDGYGNQTRVAALGVTQIGDGGCPAIGRDPAVFGAPAGPDCLGDERYVETDFIPPDRTDGAWMLDIPRERRTYGRPGSAVVDTMRFFYDGQAFVGLSGEGNGPLATDGLVMRVAVQRTIGGAFEDTMRNAYDAHGNVVDTMNALGTLDGRAHHTRYAFDDDHLSMVSTTKTVASLDGDYDLKSIVEYDPLFEGVARMTRDFIVGAAGDDTSTVMAYDEFGRVTKVAAQGDSLESPSETYTYDYGNPSSKLTGRRSSVAGGESDLETVECTDGFGRTTQRAVRVAEGRYTVSGAALYNRRGAAVRRYLAFDATAADVCKTPPADVTFEEIAYTSTGEELAVVHPDGGLHGGVPSRLSRRYRPLSVEVFDEDDSDVDSATKDTPGVMHLDGMGRVVAFERTLTAGGPPETITITYDELGNLRGFLDPEGNEKLQTYDLTGRLLRVVDPERGTSTFSYDADSRVVRSVAGNGRATASEYDSLGRLVAQFDEAAPESSRVEYYFDKHPTCLPSTCTNGAGQLVGVRYPLGNEEAGVDAYGYDVRGQLVHSSRQLAAQTFEFTLRYDNADRVAEQVFPGGQRLRYAYDGADRLVAIEGYIDEATYTSAGQITQIRYSNGTVDKRTYDDALRPLRIETLLGNGDTAVSLEYVRNRRGKITAVHDNGVGRGAGINEARFAYDGNQRLSQATLGRADTADVETIDYQYSVLDNLLGKSSSRGADSGEHVPEIAYDAVRPHAVRQAGDVTSVLDDAGLVVSRGARTLGYDAFQRLTSVHRGEEELARYAFDVTDARVLSVEQGAKVYSPAANFEVRDGVSRLRFGATQDHTVEVRSAALQLDVLSDRSGSGNIDAADAFAATVDPAASDSTASIDELLRGSARRLLLGDAGSQTRFFAVDQAGSVVGVTDEAGQLTERIAYQPHGNVRTATAGRTENVRFAGHEVDAATGLINMGSRFYDPNDGHFLSPDPEHDTFRGVSLETMLDASNSYGYAGQDPVNAIDPTGRMIVGLAAGFTGAIATAGAANIAGAFLGGGVAVAVIMATVAAKGGWSEMSTKAKVGTVLMGIVSVALGTVSGFLTAGLSAVGDAIQGAAEVAITAGETLEHPLATPGNKLLLRLGASSFAAANALLLSPGALLKAVFTGSVALLKPLGRYVVEVAPGAFKRWGNRRAQAAAAKASEGASRAIEQRNRTAASERAQGWFMNNERHAKLIARRAAKAQAAPKPGRIQRLLGRGK
jgi:RHS repeat-associated protein